MGGDGDNKVNRYSNEKIPECSRCKEIKIVATIKRSAGNGSVGDMWDETGIFELSTPLEKVMDWAYYRKHGGFTEGRYLEGLNAHVILTVAKNTDI